MIDGVVELIPRLRQYARRLTGNDFDADDLVQETMVRVLLSPDKYIEKGLLVRWLMRIMRNRYIDMKRAAADVPTDPLALAENVPAPDDPEIFMRTRDVWRVLSVMPLALSDALIASSCGETAADISSRMGVGAGTVRSRAYRARARLRAVLGD